MPKESTLRSMALCLFLVCLVCAALLGGVYVLTLDKISQEVVKKTNNAIALVTPEFDNAPSSEKTVVEIDGKEVAVYPAKKDGQTVGYAVESFTSKGFSGTISIMVGFDMDGNITGTSVISHAESPRSIPSSWAGIPPHSAWLSPRTVERWMPSRLQPLLPGPTAMRWTGPGEYFRK